MAKIAHRLSSVVGETLSAIRTQLLDRLHGRLAIKLQQYSTVAEEESLSRNDGMEEESGDVSTRQRRPNLIKIVIVVTVVGIFLAELLVVIFLPTGGQEKGPIDAISSPPAYKSIEVAGLKDCGDSADTALDRGCQFDYLTISWQKPECYHTDIIDDFFRTHDWEFYIDANGTKISSWDEMPSGSRRYNVRWDFHFTHCIYAWRMMQTAILERRPLANYLLEMDHTRHCMEVGLDRRWEWSDMHTLVHVKWPQCLPYGQWNTTVYVDNLVLD